MIYAGLDIETTGLDHTQGHRLIQVAIAYGVTNICVDVLPVGNMAIDVEALAVNRFTLERIGLALRQEIVDNLILEQVACLGLRPGDLTAVGWNVGSFDLPFVKKELPKTAALFSHRVIDLTGIAQLAAEHNRTDRETVKRAWHQRAAEIMGGEPNWHNAGWDARAALTVWDWLRTSQKALVEWTL